MSASPTLRVWPTAGSCILYYKTLSSASVQHRPSPTCQCTDQAFGRNKKSKRKLVGAGETAVRLLGELSQERLGEPPPFVSCGQPVEPPFSSRWSKGAGSLDALGLARGLVGPGEEQSQRNRGGGCIALWRTPLSRLHTASCMCGAGRDARYWDQRCPLGGGRERQGTHPGSRQCPEAQGRVEAEWMG